MVDHSRVSATVFWKATVDIGTNYTNKVYRDLSVSLPQWPWSFKFPTLRCDSDSNALWLFRKLCKSGLLSLPRSISSLDLVSPRQTHHTSSDLHNSKECRLWTTEMRGYHIRIVVQRKVGLSTSQPHTADNFIPTTLFQHLPSQKPKPTVRRNALDNPQHKDYRFGPIRLDWVDFEDMNKAAYSSIGKGREHDRGVFLHLCILSLCLKRLT